MMTASRATFVAVAAATSLAAAGARAQEATNEEWADPGLLKPSVQMDFGIRGVTSLNGIKSYSDPGASGNAVGVVDFSDTYAYARGRTPLANGGRVGSLVAVTFPDAYYQPGTLFLAEANAFYEDRWLTMRIGRARMRSQIIRMPLLRDDDLIRFTDEQNPFSQGTTTADHQYGNTADLSLWATPRLYLDLHAENKPTSLLPQSTSQFTINAYGLSLGYRQIAAEVPMSILRHIGAGMNFYNVRAEGQPIIWDALAGAWFNLVADPMHMVDLRLHGIYIRGVDTARLDTLADSFRTKQASVTGSIGYAYRKHLLPTFRTNVIGAYKRYIDASVDQYSVVANAFVSTGLTSEIGLQYQFRNRASEVPEAFGDHFAHSIKLAFIVVLDTSSGPSFDTRESPLNSQSGYLP